MYLPNTAASSTSSATNKSKGSYILLPFNIGLGGASSSTDHQKNIATITLRILALVIGVGSLIILASSSSSSGSSSNSSRIPFSRKLSSHYNDDDISSTLSTTNKNLPGVRRLPLTAPITRNLQIGQMADIAPNQAVVFATRIHLGHAKTPPVQSDLEKTVSTFLQWVQSCGTNRAAIAVDPAPKIDGYDLVQAVQDAVTAYQSSATGATVTCDVIPVSPWGKFVPALNALIAWAASTGASRIMFASAETSVSPDSVQVLLDAIDDDTLVAGCALPGHEYQPQSEEVVLTGRTTPWNTCAVWNLSKVAMTGFPLVSEGLHPNDDGTEGPSGVEEASCISVLQRILPRGTAVAKLIGVPGVTWEAEWQDEERRAWHEKKMKSKAERAARHLTVLGLEGESTVVHL